MTIIDWEFILSTFSKQKYISSLNTTENKHLNVIIKIFNFLRCANVEVIVKWGDLDRTWKNSLEGILDRSVLIWW